MTGGGIDIDRVIRRIAAAEPRGARGVLIIAVLCVSAAIAIRLLLAPLFGDTAAFMTFIPAVIVAATWLVHGGYNKLLEGSARHLAIVQATPGFEGRTGEPVPA